MAECVGVLFMSYAVENCYLGAPVEMPSDDSVYSSGCDCTVSVAGGFPGDYYD